MSDTEPAGLVDPATGHPTKIMRAESRWPGPDPHRAETLLAFSDARYRDAFWPGRRYEDMCDRIALRAMLPPSGQRLVDIGAGYGRLADEYAGYGEVVLVDISEALLNAARQRLAADPRYRIVAADAFSLPFPDASMDAAVCVRVAHHFQDPRPAIAEFARVLRPGGVLVFEFRNKRDIKAIAAYALRRQAWSPAARGSRRYEGIHLVSTIPIGRAPQRADDPTGHAEPGAVWSAPVSFVHAPADVTTWLRAAGLQPSATRSVGIFRLPLVTGHVPAWLLIRLERLLQVALAPVTAGPSLFVRAVRRSSGDSR